MIEGAELDIREITRDEKQRIDEVVSVHLAAFEGFFLTFLGKGFLRQMYTSYCEFPSSALLGAFSDGRLVGFLAYSEDMSGLYRFMLKKKLVPFAWYSLGAFFRRPKVFIRLVRALLRPSEAYRKETYVELASIGVRPDVKSLGTGSQLIAALKKRVNFTQYAYITLETDAEHNESVNCFYRKNGFILAREYETREGRKMNEYRYRGPA